MKTAEDYWADHSIISRYSGEHRTITEASFKHVVRLAQSECREELDTLKKVYNDLAESHAKIEIEALVHNNSIVILERENLSLHHQLSHSESELSKAKEGYSELIQKFEAKMKTFLSPERYQGMQIAKDMVEEFLNKK